MKKTLIALALLLPVVALLAQTYANKEPTPDERKKLAGATSFVQSELLRDKTPRFVLNSLFYNATNYYDGIVLVRTNATVLVHIGLPNPTNNPSREYRVTTMGASTATLSNSLAVGTFTDMFTMTNSSVYFIESNKTATAYSTGTNWVVRLH